MFKSLINSKVLFITLICLLVMLPVAAQDDSSHVLTLGQPVSNTIDESNAAQIYTFTANAEDVVTVMIDTPASFVLTAILSDLQGVNLAQAQFTTDVTQQDDGLSNITITQSGTYYITVFPSTNTETITGEFTITLMAGGEEVTAAVQEATPVPATSVTYQQGQVSLLNGMQVSLRWDTQDDFNLEVRDPNGEKLLWDSRITTSGGSFGADVNGLCETITSPAIETASWPSGAHATGSYEILVYYRQSCTGSVNPVNFTVDIQVDNATLQTATGTLRPPSAVGANVFITSFVLNSDGSATNGLGGVYSDTRTLPIPPQDFIASATPISIDIPIQGTIAGQQAWQAYSFEGLSGQVIEITMTKTLGSLDTLLVLLDSSGNIIDANDDAQDVVNTNSIIRSLRLPTDDTYTIVATRYGKDLGGTEGTYNLLVSTSNVPTEILDFDLPSGDIEIALVWNTNADLQLLVRDPYGNAVFDDVPRILSGGRLEATGNINCTVSEGTPIYYTYWPDGFIRTGAYEIEVYHQSDCGDYSPVTFTLYVVVKGEMVFTDIQSISFGQKYISSFTIDQNEEAVAGLGGILGGSETIDHFSELESSVFIEDGNIVSGSISLENKFDLYVFEGEAGDIVRIVMDQTSGTLDTLLFVIDPNGLEIAANDDANESTNSMISSLQLTQDGEYIIIATHFGTTYGVTIGGYDLAIQIDR